MNLKPRNRSEVYDKLYVLASKVLSKSSACSTCPIQCATGRSRSDCCAGCKHLGPNGCTVAALACKLHLCIAEGNIQQTINPKLMRKLSRLTRIATHYKVWVARGDKQESLDYGHGHPWAIYPNSPEAAGSC